MTGYLSQSKALRPLDHFPNSRRFGDKSTIPSEHFIAQWGKKKKIIAG